MTYSINTLSKSLLHDILSLLGKQHFIIVGSFALAVLEHEILKTHTITFHDIDILCTPNLKKHCMPLYEHFKKKHNVELSFNFYNPQYVGVEEVIQESSLFNINRILLNVSEGKIIYDSSTFDSPTSLLTTYFTKDIEFNPDCCVYYYRKFEKNLEQFNKYAKSIYSSTLDILRKKILYTTDVEYIKSFYSSGSRYSVTPAEDSIFEEKPEGYSLVYYPVKNKFVRKVLYLEDVWGYRYKL